MPTYDCVGRQSHFFYLDKQQLKTFATYLLNCVALHLKNTE